eukprot:m.330447 g.330447  ORF g.330447 m.330447 type:complete len:55 (-) comp16046_c1_seq1:311-475(-)
MKKVAQLREAAGIAIIFKTQQHPVASPVNASEQPVTSLSREPCVKTSTILTVQT